MCRPPLISTLFPYTTLFRSPWLGRFPTRPQARLISRTPVEPALLLFQLLLQVRRGRARLHFEQTGERRSEEHTSELQSLRHLVCRLLLEKKKKRVTSLVTLQ